MNSRRFLRIDIVIRAEGAFSIQNDAYVGYRGAYAPISSADGPSVVLRLRSCCDATCRTVFTICAGCDRGQRYCSVTCRQRMRRQQVRAAGRRYQASPKGKLRHLLRQRTYRRRQSQADVTHHPERSITNSPDHEAQHLYQCVKCLRQSAWIDPFTDFRPPQRWRHRPRAPAHVRSRPARVQKTSLFRDR